MLCGHHYLLHLKSRVCHVVYFMYNLYSVVRCFKEIGCVSVTYNKMLICNMQKKIFQNVLNSGRIVCVTDIVRDVSESRNNN